MHGLGECGGGGGVAIQFLFPSSRKREATGRALCETQRKMRAKHSRSCPSGAHDAGSRRSSRHRGRSSARMTEELICTGCAVRWLDATRPSSAPRHRKRHRWSDDTRNPDRVVSNRKRSQRPTRESPLPVPCPHGERVRVRGAHGFNFSILYLSVATRPEQQWHEGSKLQSDNCVNEKSARLQ